MFRTDVEINEEQIPATIKSIVESFSSKSSKMKQLFDLGLSVKEITNTMNVRYNFVYNVISNYVNINDIPISKIASESKKEAIIEAFLAGKSNKVIAHELKLNYNYIYKVIREYIMVNKPSAPVEPVIVDEPEVGLLPEPIVEPEPMIEPVVAEPEPIVEVIEEAEEEEVDDPDWKEALYDIKVWEQAQAQEEEVTPQVEVHRVPSSQPLWDAARASRQSKGKGLFKR